MSRSRHQKSCGRGCGVCGDAGEARRARELDAHRADEREDPDPERSLLADACEGLVPRSGTAPL